MTSVGSWEQVTPVFKWIAMACWFESISIKEFNMSMNVTTVTFDYSPSTSWDEWRDSIPLDQSDNICPKRLDFWDDPKKPLANSIKNPKFIVTQPNSTQWQKPYTPFTSSSIHPKHWDFVSQTRRSRSQTQRAVALSWLGGARRAPRLWGGWGVEGASSLVETYHNLGKSWRFNLPNPPICYSSGWFCIMESWPHAFFCKKNELQFARHVFLWERWWVSKKSTSNWRKFAGNVQTWISAEFPKSDSPSKELLELPHGFHEVRCLQQIRRLLLVV